MGDNAAVLEGYTQEYITTDSNGGARYLLVKPDETFELPYRAWDMDQQEFVIIAE